MEVTLDSLRILRGSLMQLNMHRKIKIDRIVRLIINYRERGRSKIYQSAFSLVKTCEFMRRLTAFVYLLLDLVVRRPLTLWVDLSTDFVRVWLTEPWDL